MNTILEVAIGMLFVFLLFSLLVSAVNEAIFGHLTHLRSRVLEDSLHAILSKQAKGFAVWAWLRRGFRAPARTGGLFATDLLKHPLVTGLVVGAQRAPSYLPARTFVDAALGTLLSLGTQASPPLSPEIDRIEASDLADAISRLSDEHARKVLSSVLAGAKTLEDARNRLETWFNNSMERVSGAYKRYTQFWLYVWSTLIVVWLNVDTIELTQRLVGDAQFRGALAAGAVTFVAQANASNHLADPNVPAAASSGSGSLSVPEILQEVGKLNLPLGWGACTNETQHSWIGAIITRLPRLEQSAGISTNSTAYSFVSGALGTAAPCPETPGAWQLKLLGLLITIAAISQGAPFWFDLLNRVTNLRAAGRPPQAGKGRD